MLVKEVTYTLMGLNMLGNGSKTNSMEKGQKYGLIMLNILEYINMVKNMEKVSFSGRMDLHIKEISITITSKVTEFIFGQVN